MAMAELDAAAAVFHDASHAEYYELALEQLAKTRKLIAGLGHESVAEHRLAGACAGPKCGR
jgi:hypothetical protein